MRLFIEPTEPLLFRTGRPFHAGENNFAETLFPPTPETLQGALRAMIAAQWAREHPRPGRTADELFQEEGLVELIGKREHERNVYGRFRITGFTLGHYDSASKQVTRLFPAPTHIIQARLKKDGQEQTRMVRLRPRPLASQWSNHPEGKQLPFPDLQGWETVGKSTPLEGWLTPLGLQRALSKQGLPEPDKPAQDKSAQDKHLYLIPAGAIYVREPRLGIGMQNATKTTRDGYLYQVEMIRMHRHYGFVVDLELGEERFGAVEMPPKQEQRSGQQAKPHDLAFLQDGWMTIGGEQRAAYLKILSPEEIAPEPGIGQSAKGNLLYFATPTYLKRGWLPENSTLFPREPLTAALNRSQPIGGWLLNPNNAGGMSKLTRRCLPAGSVYYFDQAETFPSTLTEYGWQIGYGIAYIGEYEA